MDDLKTIESKAITKAAMLGCMQDRVKNLEKEINAAINTYTCALRGAGVTTSAWIQLDNERKLGWVPWEICIEKSFWRTPLVEVTSLEIKARAVEKLDALMGALEDAMTIKKRRWVDRILFWKR